MNSPTSSHAEQILNFKYKGTSFAVGTGTAHWSGTGQPVLYLGLLKAAPGFDGTGGNEVSGGNYSRKTLAGTDWNNASTSNSATTLTLAAALTFATPSADWGIITHVGVFSASSSGNLLDVCELTTSVNVTSGNAPIIAAGEAGVVIRYGYLG